MSKKFNDFLMEIGGKVMSTSMTWEEAAKELNELTGNDYGESTYRKRYKYLCEGIDYINSKEDESYIRILSISDLHIPFQRDAEVFSDFIGKVDILQLNGDIVDCQALSKFPKVFRMSPIEEIIEARRYCIGLIRMIKPKKVVVNVGNHDIRFQNYIAKNIDSDLLELMPRTSLQLIFVDGFKRYNKFTGESTSFKPICEVVDAEIEFVDDWYSQIGKTIFCHPLSFSSGMMATAEKARRYFKDSGYEFDTLVMAHTHRIGYYFVGDTRIYEQGAACDTSKMNYIDGKLTTPQKEGFIYLCQDSEGNLIKSTVQQIELN
jgi:predicted phosphodiesterase